MTEISKIAWRADLASAAFGKSTIVYGQIDENGPSVRKWSARKIPITDKCSGKRLLSVNPHHNGQKFTDKSPENTGLSVKCVLITDKSVKNGTLSVNLNEILDRSVEHYCRLKKVAFIHRKLKKTDEVSRKSTGFVRFFV